MATAIRRGHYQSLKQDPLSDINVMVYCLLLFLFCLVLAMFSGNDNISMSWPQPDFQASPVKDPVVIPIPSQDTNIKPDYKLSI
jgi:hypothetical protein